VAGKVGRRRDDDRDCGDKTNENGIEMTMKNRKLKSLIAARIILAFILAVCLLPSLSFADFPASSGLGRVPGLTVARTEDQLRAFSTDPNGTVKVMEDMSLTAPFIIPSGKTYSAAPDAVLSTNGQLLTFAEGSRIEDNGGQMFDSSPGEVVLSSETITPIMFGADRLGILDSSDAFEVATYVALEGSGRLKIPSGTYKATTTITSSAIKDLIVEGDAGFTTIKPANSGDDVFTVSFVGGERFAIFKDIEIDGVDRAGNGIVIFNTGNSIRFENVRIKNCDKGIFKSGGNWFVVYDGCTLYANNYGVYAINSGINHAGADKFVNGSLSGNLLVGYYIDDTSMAVGHTYIAHSIIENCAGYGIYIRNYVNGNPFTIDDVWTELNGTAASVEIEHVSDSTTSTHTPAHDLYVGNALRVNIKNSRNIVKIDTVSSTIFLDNARAAVYENTDSIIVSASPELLNNEFIYNQISLGPHIPRDNYHAVWVAPHRSSLMRTKPGATMANLCPTYATFGYDGRRDFSDGLLMGYGRWFDLLSGGYQVNHTSLFDVPAGWVLITFALKNPDGLVRVSVEGVGSVDGFTLADTSDIWRTFVSLKHLASDQSGVNFKVSEVSSVPQRVHIADVQVLSFETLQAALAYYQSGIYSTNEWPVEVYDLAAPLTQVWGIGDRCINRPAAVGTPKAWTCTVAGGSYSATRADSTAYAERVWIKWSSGTTVWECTTAGTSDSSAPSIVGKVVGDTVVDGGVTWTLRSLTAATWVSEGNL